MTNTIKQNDPRQILTVNSGSSSIKFALFHIGEPETLEVSGQIDRIGIGGGVFRVKRADGTGVADQSLDCADHENAFHFLFTWLRDWAEANEVAAVGHRVVHGGIQNVQPCLVSSELITSLKTLVSLAPEHLPHEIRAIEAISSEYPGLPQVACFDTAFHRKMPKMAQTYALPRHLQDEGVLRYGFHGLSYEYIVGELRRESPAAADGRLIIAHLGNGASMAAVHQGVSIDTTMGFTPAGGLVMSTRSGDLDPGVLVYLLAKNGMSPANVNNLINKQAGLLGLSGTSSSMQDLLNIEPEDAHAAEAVNLFCYQAKKTLASLVAALGGLDTLIFTAGIGEHSPAVRSRICRDIGFLGITLDRERNELNAPIISSTDSTVNVRVMKANEEAMIARHTAHLLLRR